MPASHVVLIRGINVGGKNIVPMAALREALEGAGLSDVRSYIQSGNLLVRSRRRPSGVTKIVEEVLSGDFGVSTVVVTVSAGMYREVMADAPAGFGDDLDTYRCDVIFLRPSLPSADALAVLELREGVDEVWQGRHAVYFRRLNSRASQSRINKVVGTAAYKDMTIRNWNTTARLAAMLDE